MALNTINQQHFRLICYYIEKMAVLECRHLISFHNRTLRVTYYKGIAEKKEDIDRCLQYPHFRHHDHLQDETWNWLQDSQRRMGSTNHEIVFNQRGSDLQGYEGQKREHDAASDEKTHDCFLHRAPEVFFDHCEKEHDLSKEG